MAIGREAYLADEVRILAAERCLHLAQQCVIDIANHLISVHDLAVPESYGQAFEVLAVAGILPKKLAPRLRQMAGMRNLLVHAYLDIDHGRVHDSIQSNLNDLREFAGLMTQLLEDERE